MWLRSMLVAGIVDKGRQVSDRDLRSAVISAGGCAAVACGSVHVVGLDHHPRLALHPIHRLPTSLLP